MCLFEANKSCIALRSCTERFYPDRAGLKNRISTFPGKQSSRRIETLQSQNVVTVWSRVGVYTYECRQLALNETVVARNDRLLEGTASHSPYDLRLKTIAFPLPLHYCCVTKLVMYADTHSLSYRAPGRHCCTLMDSHNYMQGHIETSVVH